MNIYLVSVFVPEACAFRDVVVTADDVGDALNKFRALLECSGLWLELGSNDCFFTAVSFVGVCDASKK